MANPYYLTPQQLGHAVTWGGPGAPFFPPYAYANAVLARAKQRPDPRSNWPTPSEPLAPARWFLDPSTGNIGLGKYQGFSRKKASRSRAPKSRDRKKKRRSYRPKGVRIQRRRMGRPRIAVGRGGFWGDLWGGIKDVGKTAAAVAMPMAKQLLMKAVAGGGAYSASGPQGAPVFGPGGYVAEGPLGNPVFEAGAGRYYGGGRRARYHGTGLYTDSSQGLCTQATSSDEAMIANAIRGGNTTTSTNEYGTVQKQNIPTIVNASEGQVVISHTEYVADIVSNGPDFSVVGQIALNPGLDPEHGGAFPWLSKIAQHFQMYRFSGLMFNFISTSGTFSGVSQALGEVIMSTNYNVNDPAPRSKQEMLAQAFSRAVVPSADFSVNIETDPKQTMGNGKFFVRGGELRNNEDPTTYDLGEMNIAVQGQSVAPGTSVTLGSLYVTYQVELMRPQLPVVMRQNTATDNGSHYQTGAVAYTLPATPGAGDGLFGFHVNQEDHRLFDSMGIVYGPNGTPNAFGIRSGQFWTAVMTITLTFQTVADYAALPANWNLILFIDQPTTSKQIAAHNVNPVLPYSNFNPNTETSQAGAVYSQATVPAAQMARSMPIPSFFASAAAGQVGPVQAQFLISVDTTNIGDNEIAFLNLGLIDSGAEYQAGKNVFWDITFRVIDPQEASVFGLGKGTRRGGGPTQPFDQDDPGSA